MNINDAISCNAKTCVPVPKTDVNFSSCISGPKTNAPPSFAKSNIFCINNPRFKNIVLPIGTLNIKTAIKICKAKPVPIVL